MVDVQEDSFRVPRLELPEFLAKTYVDGGKCVVNIDRLYVGLLPVSGRLASYVPVYDTPHYSFARHILEGVKWESVNGYRDYVHYASLHAHASTEDVFRELIFSIKRSGYDSTNRPIFVFRSWRRPWPLSRWDVADGFHRLAVLAAMGEEFITVRKLRPRKNVMRRGIARLLRVRLHADREQKPRRSIPQ